jgi:hypothetical protein
MKSTKIAIYTMVTVLAVLGCKNNHYQTGQTSKNQVDGDSIAVTDSIEPSQKDMSSESLLFWASDTAVATNPRLMVLLDTLYQHVRKDDFPAEAKKEAKWMTEYRSKLCLYYDSVSLGRSSLSNFTKAERVLKEGAKLLKLGSQEGTMEMIVYNDALATFEQYKAYSHLTQIANKFRNQKTKELVYEEWTLSEKMRKQTTKVVVKLIGLSYWGGSISGVVCTEAVSKILNARNDMYQIIQGKKKTRGEDVSLNKLEDALVNSCNKSLVESAKYSEYFSGTGYYSELQNTKSEIKKLRPIISKWIKVIGKLTSDEAYTSIYRRSNIKLASSYMLTKWIDCIKQSM